MVAPYPVRLFRRFAWPDPAPSFEDPADYGLRPQPFETTASDGLRIRGWWFAPPDPWGVVVVCHARGASKSRTLGHVRLLRERGLAVAAFDFRACGDSDAPARKRWGSLWDPLRDLEAVVGHVEERTAGDPRLRGRMALLGCSFGGNMAIAHAGTTGRRYPAVVLDSTPLVRWVDMLDTLLARERRTARFAGPRAVTDRLVARAVAAWTRAGPLYRHAERSVRNLHGTSVLHIVGERDSLFDVEESCRFLRTRCAGRTEVWRVPRGRHLTNHVVDPARYADRVARFLAEAFGSTESPLGSPCHEQTSPHSSTSSSATIASP
jgi:alpha-beta hydrolase superfamily lysophospholipase